MLDEQGTTNLWDQLDSVFGLEHFDHVMGEFVDYYHDCRPHQGIGNRLIGAEDSDVSHLIEGIEQLAC